LLPAQTFSVGTATRGQGRGEPRVPGHTKPWLFIGPAETGWAVPGEACGSQPWLRSGSASWLCVAIEVTVLRLAPARLRWPVDALGIRSSSRSTRTTSPICGEPVLSVTRQTFEPRNLSTSGEMNCQVAALNRRNNPVVAADRSSRRDRQRQIGPWSRSRIDGPPIGRSGECPGRPGSLVTRYSPPAAANYRAT